MQASPSIDSLGWPLVSRQFCAAFMTYAGQQSDQALQVGMSQLTKQSVRTSRMAK